MLCFKKNVVSRSIGHSAITEKHDTGFPVCVRCCWKGHFFSTAKSNVIFHTLVNLVCFFPAWCSYVCICRSRLYDLFGQIEREFELLYADNLACE